MTEKLTTARIDPAQFLDHARRRQATSDASAARILGVSRQTIFRWRHGSHTTVYVADRVCTHLKRHIDEFVDELIAGRPHVDDVR